ncbi:Dam family site-specific DNA-(adenine-N6)-methyltransferase [Sphingobacterium sp.]|uniref:DNA adenine methylase n=1 Tax=Sphingobacterium sp. TaxID=341027 RepID=UPI002898F849|nr:Dam family site-specific DNA-(adenine-N6)-methyltransferase [Sphingobacterium sp.]
MGIRYLTKEYKPFLRWAGGKTWLYKLLDNNTLPNFNNYHEPFLGGGAIFFKIGATKNSFLSDLNEDLINTYSVIKNDVYDLIHILIDYQNNKDFYYKIREFEPSSDVEKAARFFFLNQTSFNGIYRVNLKGKYNVPYGFRNKNFLDKELLIETSEALQMSNLFVSDFNIIKDNLRSDDLIFLDPPYTVSHNNNGFVKYNEKIFSLEDQYRLNELIKFIKDKGAYYILTNAAHVKIDEIFTNIDYKLEVKRASLIGGVNAFRGNTSEYLFSNIDLRQ